MQRRTLSAGAGLVIVMAALGACRADDAGVDEESTGAPESTGDPSESTGETGETGDEESTETGFDPPVEDCGNGYVEGDEECDDGNRDDEDDCSNRCVSQIPCGIEWQSLRPAPTLASDISGLQIVRDGADNLIVAGFVQENVVEQDMTVTEGDLEVLIMQFGPGGRPGWETTIAEADVQLTPQGLAVDDAGDIYLAVNRDTAGFGNDFSVHALSGADGSESWSFTQDSALMDSEDFVFGVAVADDGDVLVAGEVPVVDGDDDAWLRKVAADDGTEVWTETVSGQFDNGFSVDDGGPVAVAPDGSIYLFMEEYVNFETVEATVVKFGPDGGAPLWTFAPLADGNPHRHIASIITTDADSNVLFVAERGSPAPHLWLYKIDGDQEVAWSLETEDFDPDNQDYIFAGVAVADDGSILVGGPWRNENNFENTAWWEVWFTRMSPDADVLCSSTFQSPSESLLPASVFPEGLTSSSAGGAVFTGNHFLDDATSLWTGQFGPE